MDKQVKTFFKKTLKDAPSLQGLYRDIQSDLNRVEKALQDFSQSDNPIIKEISDYLFEKAGKRIRPALLILSAKMFGYNGNEHILMSSLVETIHTASLIHDDIIDNSETRRGKATVHSRWGPNITVLLGDFLYIKALHHSLKAGRPEITEILTSTSSQMIDGELQEYSHSENLSLTEEEYFEILNKKTASLFAASCRIGGILGNAGHEEIEILIQYGTNLGLSFQVTDDLLDYTGKKSLLGKPVLSDLIEGRITLPLIYAINQGGRDIKEKISRLYEKRVDDENSRSQILEIIKSNGALDYSYRKAVDFSRRAQELSNFLPSSAHRQTLAHISDYILYRNK